MRCNMQTKEVHIFGYRALCAYWRYESRLADITCRYVRIGPLLCTNLRREHPSLQMALMLFARARGCSGARSRERMILQMNRWVFASASSNRGKINSSFVNGKLDIVISRLRNMHLVRSNVSAVLSFTFLKVEEYIRIIFFFFLNCHHCEILASPFEARSNRSPRLGNGEKSNLIVCGKPRKFEARKL